MLVMLAAIFLCVLTGVLSQQFGARVYLTVTLLATTMTALYYFVERAL
jgi:hypothetical protein